MSEKNLSNELRILDLVSEKGQYASNIIGAIKNKENRVIKNVDLLENLNLKKLDEDDYFEVSKALIGELNKEDSLLVLNSIDKSFLPQNRDSYQELCETFFDKFDGISSCQFLSLLHEKADTSVEFLRPIIPNIVNVFPLECKQDILSNLNKCSFREELIGDLKKCLEDGIWKDINGPKTIDNLTDRAFKEKKEELDKPFEEYDEYLEEKEKKSKDVKNKHFIEQIENEEIEKSKKSKIKDDVEDIFGN